MGAAPSDRPLALSFAARNPAIMVMRNVAITSTVDRARPGLIRRPVSFHSHCWTSNSTVIASPSRRNDPHGGEDHSSSDSPTEVD